MDANVKYNSKVFNDESGNLVVALLEHDGNTGDGEDYKIVKKIVISTESVKIDDKEVATGITEAENVAAVDTETATAATNAAAINDILEALKTAGIMEADPEE